VLKDFNFEEHNRKKDEKRMRDYHDPEYAKGMQALFSGAVRPPERGKRKW